MAHSLQGKTAIITGASQGLGREIARHYAGEGASLTLVARDAAEALAKAQDLHGESHRAAGLALAVGAVGYVVVTLWGLVGLTRSAWRCLEGQRPDFRSFTRWDGPASGRLLKRDPGVPLVYAGFAIALAGGGLSLIATRQLWAIAEPEQGKLHLGGLCNRNLTALAQELPALVADLRGAEPQQG